MLVGLLEHRPVMRGWLRRLVEQELTSRLEAEAVAMCDGENGH